MLEVAPLFSVSSKLMIFLRRQLALEAYEGSKTQWAVNQTSSMQNNAEPSTSWENVLSRFWPHHRTRKQLFLVTYHSYSPGNLLLSGTASVFTLLERFVVPNKTANLELTL